MDNIKTLSVEEFARLQRQKEPFTLIDVRTPEEVKKCHIGGKNIPLDEIASRIDEIPTKGKVIIHCYRGQRSQKAIQKIATLRSFEALYNLEGGLRAYAQRIDPKVDPSS